MRRSLLIFTLFSVPGWSQAPAQQPAQPPIVGKVEMPPAPHRDFLGYLQALGPLIAASVAVGVGLTQFYLQRQKYKQDLFDRRFKVYSATWDFIVLAIKSRTTGLLEDSKVAKFFDDTKPGKFLFGSDVTMFLEGDLTGNLTDYRDETGQLSWRITLKPDEPLLSLIIRWGVQIDKVFGPYLRLHHDQSWPTRLKARIDRWMDSEVPAKFASKARD
jgi:hypothetical protein